MPFYYPNWINDFWRIMGLIHFGDKDHFSIPGEKRFNEADIRAFCTEHGLAFYDTATEVRRLKDNASDAFLEVVTPTDIPALLKRIPHCRTLVTTGQKATEVVAQAFGCPIPPVGEWVLLRLETPDQVGDDGGAVGGDSDAVGGDGRAAGGDGSVAADNGQQLRASGLRWLKEIGFSGTVPKNNFVQPQEEQRLHIKEEESPDQASFEVKFWRMPSTSRAYPMPLEKKAEAYRKLFPQHKKLILWDLDGTLIDTLEDLAAAVNHALELRGLPLHSVADYRKMVGHGVRNLVKQALEASLMETTDQVGGDGSVAAGDESVAAGDGSVAADNGQQLRASGLRWLKEIGFSGTVPKNNFVQPQERQLRPEAERLPDAYIDAALGDFKEYYSAHIDVHTRPYPGMQELLTELQARGVKMAVASNKFQEGTEHLIREFFPDIQFVAILGNRPGYPLKPDPEIVREVLAQAAVEKEDAIMVGDSPTDMRTAANGGIDAVAVSWGYRTEEELAGNQIAHSIEELRRLLCFT
jgi:phosphoglycolate phosphatase